MGPSIRSIAILCITAAGWATADPAHAQSAYGPSQGPGRGAVPSSGDFRFRGRQSPGNMAAAVFTIDKLNNYRVRVARLLEIPKMIPEGWSKSNSNLAKVVAVFEPLRLSREFVLRSYRYNAKGAYLEVVWAMPPTADFPEPARAPRMLEHPLKPPKPPAAAADFMEAIEGDGSPWSYMAASLLKRELEEFGARWRGCQWSTHRLLEQNPWSAGLAGEAAVYKTPIQGPTGKETDWQWTEMDPRDWRPQARVEGDRVIVTFYSYCGLNTQTIYRNTDQFHRGSYTFTTERKAIATGPKGFLP
jgi:hypothetical protein